MWSPVSPVTYVHPSCANRAFGEPRGAMLMAVPTRSSNGKLCEASRLSLPHQMLAAEIAC